MTFSFTRDSAGVTINDYLDEIPGEYAFAVDSLNNILSIKARDGGYQGEIKAATDTITINGTPFSGTAAQLKAQLLTDIFTASGGSGGSGTILQSPDETLWLIGVNDSGALQTTQVASGTPGTLHLFSPDNTQWEVTVNNSGALITTAV
jgi:hypothetical protein